jgi:pimeloyl-ACP methyl ester carboxylesterase
LENRATFAEERFVTDQIPFDDFGGEGPPLHFAHANAYPPGSYRQFLAPFLPHYQVKAVRHRPLWPGSDPAELQGDWHLVADDLSRFLAQQGWQGVIGVGHSLGAVATLYAAAKRPFLFRAIILLDPVFLLPDVLRAAAAYPERAHEFPMVVGALRRRERWPDRQDAFNRFREKAVFGRWSDEVLWDYVNSGLRQEGDEVTLVYSRLWEAQFYATPPQAVWETLPQVQTPTLAIRAAESDTLYPAAWALWQEKQPGATFVEVPDVGHMLTMERPLTVAQIILDWLEGIGDWRLEIG